jgi:predicted nucleic acid-binding protein
VTYLVDANVLSEATRPAPDAKVVQWLRNSERHSGQAMPVKDSLIAATALVHGLTIATRNVSDFKKAGVKTMDPFA